MVEGGEGWRLSSGVLSRADRSELLTLSRTQECHAPLLVLFAARAQQRLVQDPPGTACLDCRP